MFIIRDEPDIEQIVISRIRGKRIGLVVDSVIGQLFGVNAEYAQLNTL